MKTLLAVVASATVAVAQTGGTGLNWYLWNNTPWQYTGHTPTVDTSYFLNNQYSSSGAGTQNVNAWTTNNYPSVNTCTVPTNPPYQMDCQYIAVVFQGWFAATDAGNYTFATDTGIDNALFFWTGTKAFHSWTTNNFDYSALRSGDGIEAGSFTVSLSEGAFLPVTFIFINGGAPGRARMSITTPDGTGHTDTTGFFWGFNSFNPGPH